ncbi:MAG: acyl-CoA dehydrogenase family protein [Stellaceae bacterium]
MLEDVFVPALRTITMKQTRSVALSGTAVHPDYPVFRPPLMSSFGFFICAPIMASPRGRWGASPGRLAHAPRWAPPPAGHRPSGPTPTIQLRLAAAQMRFAALRATILDAAVTTVHEASRVGSISEGQRIANRRAQSCASRNAVEAVDILFEAMGAGGLFLSQDTQRYWRDAHAGVANFGVNWDAILIMCG